MVTLILSLAGGLGAGTLAGVTAARWHVPKVIVPVARALKRARERANPSDPVKAQKLEQLSIAATRRAMAEL